MPHTGRAAGGGGHGGAQVTVGTGTGLTSHQISRTRTRGSVEAAELWRLVANSYAAGSAGHRAAPARLSSSRLAAMLFF